MGTQNHEIWIVLFLEGYEAGRHKSYGRVGTLINAIDDHFGWAKAEDVPQYAVYHVNFDALTVKPVEKWPWR